MAKRRARVASSAMSRCAPTHPNSWLRGSANCPASSTVQNSASTQLSACPSPLARSATTPTAALQRAVNLFLAITIAAPAVEFRIFASSPTESHELLEIANRQRAQQHRVNKAENGCVRADAQGEGQDGNSGETGGLLQQTQG